MEKLLYFNLTYKKGWLVSQSLKNNHPVKLTAELLGSRYEFIKNTLKTDLDGCRGFIRLSLVGSVEEFDRSVRELLSNELNIDPANYVLHSSALDDNYNMIKEPDETEQPAEQTAVSEAPETPSEQASVSETPKAPKPMAKAVLFEVTFLVARLHGIPLDEAVENTMEIMKRRFNAFDLKKLGAGCEGCIPIAYEDMSSFLFFDVQDKLKEGLGQAYSGATLTFKGFKEFENIPVPPKTPEAPAEQSIVPESSEEKAAVFEIPAFRAEKVKASEGIKKSRPICGSIKGNGGFSLKANVYTKIMKLVGAEEFKALAKECFDCAQSFINDGMPDVFRSRFYLFSVSDGYGMTTYLKLFSELLEQTRLFKFPTADQFIACGGMKYTEVKLEAPNVENCFAQALDLFVRKSPARLICIDISEWLQKLSSPEFRSFLGAIEDSENGHIVIFRVPFIEKKLLKDAEYVLDDIFYVRSVSIPPFSNEELKECARAMLDQKNYTLDDGAWEIFDAMIAAEKSDGRFYGVNTVRKLVNEILFTKLVTAPTEERTVTAADIKQLADEAAGGEINVSERLNELIGMETVKKRLMEIVSQIETAKANPSLGKPSMHMRFLGNPGTGKTTIARILGQILKEKKILRNGGFIEVQGRDLCGRYIGETAPKTAGICREAYGSVLFIDEAYSLYRDDSPKDFGKEAVETLLAEMENHRDDMVVIMAGYSDEMETLMKANPGFESRIPYVVEFPNYKRGELAEIFMKLVKKSFAYDGEFENSVNEYFDSLSDEVLESKNFSNVRFVRNLFERTWGKAALRCQMEHTKCDRLTVSDLRSATADKEFASKPQEKKRRIGF